MIFTKLAYEALLQTQIKIMERLKNATKLKTQLCYIVSGCYCVSEPLLPIFVSNNRELRSRLIIVVGASRSRSNARLRGDESRWLLLFVSFPAD